jgi:exopolyphosphatase/guanosine-5'-triphosphate,3'-diphosphate pyrophosphatase
MLNRDEKEEWQRLEEWLQSIKPKKKLIGIGGNIRSFLNSCESKEMSLNEFIKKSERLSKLDTKEKIKKYKFSPDRADVIDHALHIFKFIAGQLEIQTITSTKWGISDSIAIKLFHELYSNKVSIS